MEGENPSSPELIYQQTVIEDWIPFRHPAAARACFLRVSNCVLSLKCGRWRYVLRIEFDPRTTTYGSSNSRFPACHTQHSSMQFDGMIRRKRVLLSFFSFVENWACSSLTEISWSELKTMKEHRRLPSLTDLSQLKYVMWCKFDTRLSMEFDSRRQCVYWRFQNTTGKRWTSQRFR